MKTIRTIVAVATVLGALAITNSAEAANRYAAVTIGNPLNTPVNFRWRSGNGGWNNFTLAPRTKHTFRHRYDFPDQNSSPNFYVKYDEDRGPGTFWAEGKLDRHAVPDEGVLGKIYEFRVDGPTGRYIRLFSKN